MLASPAPASAPTSAYVVETGNPNRVASTVRGVVRAAKGVEVQVVCRWQVAAEVVLVAACVEDDRPPDHVAVLSQLLRLGRGNDTDVGSTGSVRRGDRESQEQSRNARVE